MPTRTTAERAVHARARLAGDRNIWIATAATDGSPHLVPLSLAWLDGAIVVATPSGTLTARNAAASGRARATLDGADDVVLFDADVDVIPFDGADRAVRDAYIAAVGWDPQDTPGEWSLLVLRLRRGHAWNGPAEIDGRTILADGRWLG